MKSYSLPAALLLSSSVVLADQATTLSPVLVTATRTAETADETLASVTVISRDDIERSQAQMLPEILRTVPGLSVVNNGGLGQSSSVFLRGTNSDHVLVMIDGIKVGSATLGTYSFQDLPLSQVERIEVVRGPRSSLYGSEAIGGVIQIFTRKGTGEIKPRLSVTVGSHNTLRSDASLSGGDASGWFNLGVSALSTDGFDVKQDSETDRDGYDNRALTLRAGREFGESSEVELHLLRSDGEADFDGSFQNSGESSQQVLGVRLSTAMTDNWQSSVQLGRSWDDTDSYLDGVFSSRFDTVRDNVSWQNDIALGLSDLLTLGLDYQNDEVSSTEAFSVTERDNKGAFAQYQTALGRHELIASLRADDNEQFGRHNTGSLAWGYSLANDLRLSASYGTAFKAPSFNELYYPGYGNPDLGPEESRSLEVGVSGQVGNGRWAVNVYETRIDDLIAYDSSTFGPANIQNARIRGIETVLSQTLGEWLFNANLTLLEPEDTDTGNELPRRARETLQLDLDRQFGALGLGASLHTEGSRYDNLSNSTKMDGHTTLDLRVRYAIARDWSVQARVANLFDDQYETAATYNEEGRTVFVTLAYQP